MGAKLGGERREDLVGAYLYRASAVPKVRAKLQHYDGACWDLVTAKALRFQMYYKTCCKSSSGWTFDVLQYLTQYKLSSFDWGM